MMLPRAFHSLDYYRPAAAYRVLPFRFMRWSLEEVLVVNEVGEYVFLDTDAFAQFVQRTLEPMRPEYRELRARHILADADAIAPLALLATKWRTKKAHLAGFTKLHLFVVTLRCDHSCRYCQVSRVTADRTRFDMPAAIAEQAVDLMFNSPARHLKVEFQGGEPLLAFERIAQIVTLVEERNAVEQRQIEFVIASNLVPLTDEMLAFMATHHIVLSTSLDGPASLHNANRPRPGMDSYARVLENLARARAVLGHDRVAAVMTTTERSLASPHAIIDEYLQQGFDAIFLRPISPYGFAARTGEAARYQTDAFLAFYKKALAYIIEVNRTGTPFIEIFAQILLTKILTPFPTGYVDLQSPAGTVLGAVAYNFDGRVYASDEARMLAAMGDDAFCLGHVTDGYEKLFGGPIARALAAATVLETLPGCSDCAFLPYCGADPVYHYRTQGDVIGHKTTSAFCQKNLTLIRHLLDLLRTADQFTRALLTAWGTGIPAPP